MQPNADPNIRLLDQSEIRTQQASGPLVLTLAYILDDWRLVAAQCAIFLVTVLYYDYGPYVLLYRKLLKPLGLVKADVRPDNPEPHRFATLIGFAILVAATYLLATGAAVWGWMLAATLVILGTVAFYGWCAGCFFYYLLNRLGASGFFRYAPIEGSGFPGARPPKSSGR